MSVTTFSKEIVKPLVIRSAQYTGGDQQHTFKNNFNIMINSDEIFSRNANRRKRCNKNNCLSLTAFYPPEATLIQKCQFLKKHSTGTVPLNARNFSQMEF
jgi:hypothetical protein